MRQLIAIAATLLLLSSCEKATTNNAGVVGVTPNAPEARVTTGTRTSNNLALPTVTVSRAGNLPDLLAKFPAGQRQLIEEFYMSYGGSQHGVSRFNFASPLDFKTKEQYEWMIAGGFPTPDEIVAAHQMSDAELEKLAKSGNLKAAIFLVRRLSEGAVAGDSGELAQHLTSQIVASGLPFAGYVVADRGQREGRPPDVIAGYAYAAHLGDSRALDFMRSYEARGVSINATDAVTTYRMLLSTSTRNPALVSLRSVAARRQFPRFN